MKKQSFYFILFSIFYFLFSINVSNAITPQATDSEDVNQRIKQQLIQNIASRVAQLKLIEKRGIVGTVTEVSNTQITLSDLNNNLRLVDVDELTRFSSPSVKGSFGISDITRGTTVSVLGLYNKESRRILARFIDVIVMPKIIHGFVNSTNTDNHTVGLTTDEGEKTIDVETITKTLAYTLDGGLIRSGFSKITKDEAMIVIGFTNTRDRDKIVAAKILIFPEIIKNPKPPL